MGNPASMVMSGLAAQSGAVLMRAAPGDESPGSVNEAE